MGHPHGGHIEHCSQMEGQAGSAGVVPAGGIDQEHLGGTIQAPHRLLEKRAFAEGQQARMVSSAGFALHRHLVDHPAFSKHGRPGPSRLPGRARSRPSSAEAHEASPYRPGFLAGHPRLGRQTGQLELGLAECFLRSRPAVLSHVQQGR